MTSHAAAGQLQQRPTAREGGLFKREWFSNPLRRVPYEKLNLVRAWDLASASDPSNDPDYTVGLLMGRDCDTRMIEAHHLVGQLQGYRASSERELGSKENRADPFVA
jgi:phage terminase large subunit-like protein